MKAVNDILLNMFTSNDELQRRLNTPSLSNGVVYASDGHVLIAIPQSDLSLTYKEVEKYPNAAKLLSSMKCNSSVKIDVDTLAKELAKCRMEADKLVLQCKECKGSGFVEWNYKDNCHKRHEEEHECPICEGEGKEEKNHPFPRISLGTRTNEGDKLIQIRIGDLYFYPFQIYRLFMVALVKGFKEIEIHYDSNKYGQTIAHFGDIKVLVMCVSPT